MLTQRGPGSWLIDGIAVARGKARYGRFLRSGKYALVHSDGKVVAALVHPNASPMAARRENLNVVTRVLQAAHVPYFCVRGFDDLTSVVGVAEAHRPAVLTALRTAYASVPMHLAPVAGSQCGFFRVAGRRPSWPITKASVVRAVQHITNPTGSLVMGAANGCDIEFWREVSGMLHAPRQNRAADSVTTDGLPVQLHESTFTRMVASHSVDAPSWPSRPEMVGDLIDDLAFPIDVVYTWVDGSDPAWQLRRDVALHNVTGRLNSQATNASRYACRDEIRYSLRSINTYASWVRHIWLVVDDQIPQWLDASHHRVTVVTHKNLFGSRGTLPTFNSHAIETQLHHIDGLAEHFLYINDDVFFGRPLLPTMFFEPNGVPRIFPSSSKIDAGPIDGDLDIPSTAAAKNTRRVIERQFGRRVTFKMKHVPVALRRSIFKEMNVMYHQEFEETASHQFRHQRDVSTTSSLYQYQAYLSGRAVLGRISYMYVDLSDRRTTSLLRLALAKRQFDVFCINDTDSQPGALVGQSALMRTFLGTYFPVAAPWERRDA